MRPCKVTPMPRSCPFSLFCWRPQHTRTSSLAIGRTLQVQSPAWCSHQNFTLGSWHQTTLSGNVLDYYLVRDTLAGTSALTTDWAIPWRPHALLTEQLQVRFQCAQKQPPPHRGGPTKGFMQAIEDVRKHWVGTPTRGQFLDACHHWEKFRDPHAATLLQCTMAHQEVAHDEAHLQYKEWLLQGQAKGLRGLFRNLKSSEVAWERPYRNIPQPQRQRMDHRLQDLGRLWDIRQDNEPRPRPSLQEQAQQQAQQLPPLTTGQLARVFKALPDKASGPDAVSAQLLKQAPPLSLAPLLKLYQDMEQQAQLPTQQRMHMVVMLPKNTTLERPITLTSVLYRVWCWLRKPLLDQSPDGP